MLSTRHCLSNAGATCLALLTRHVLWPRPSHSLCPTLSWQLTNTNPTLTTILPRPWAPLDREESARTSQVIVSLMPPPCPTVGGAVCADLRRSPQPPAFMSQCHSLSEGPASPSSGGARQRQRRPLAGPHDRWALPWCGGWEAVIRGQLCPQGKSPTLWRLRGEAAGEDAGTFARCGMVPPAPQLPGCRERVTNCPRGERALR